MNESKFAKDSEKKNPNSKKKRRATRTQSNSTKFDKCGKGSESERGYIRDNDPSWYTSYPGIYSATANLNFNTPVGVPIDLFDEQAQVIGNGEATITVPNVMAFGLVLTPGVTHDASSIINTSMFQNYNFVRHANSGSKNYDAVDLQMYFLAVDEALCFLWQGIRAYGTLGAFSALNRAIPKSLFTAYGLDYASWTANPSQIRARLNLAATKMASLCVPKSARLNARHQSLFQNVFMDGTSIKSQMYVFNTVFIHEWGKLSNVGKLTAKVAFTPSDSLMTADQYFDMLDGLLKPLLEDEDINIMSGDVLKAYGAGGLLPIPTVPEGYVTPIQTSEEAPYMMSQIENMRWINLANYDITQSLDGHIVFDPYMAFKDSEILTSSQVRMPFIADLLNARKPEVTNDDIMELTRLHPTYQSVNGTDNKVEVHVHSCGSELPHSVYIVTSDGKVDTVANVASNQSSTSFSGVPQSFFYFDYAPYLYVAAVVNEGDRYKGKVTNVIGDLSNYTKVSKYNILLLHDTAVASLLLLDNATSKSSQV